MANYIALELNEDQLLVAAAKTTGRSCKISHAFSIDLEPDQSATEIGERLKEELDSRSIARADALCVVNRTQVEIREFTLPPAPDSELPNLVRFQAKSEFTALNEDWLLDYVPFDGIADGPRRVLATAMSPDHVTRLTEISEAAGAKFKRVLFRPYALCDLMADRLGDSGERLIVDPNGEQIDLTVTDGSSLLATRTVRIAELDNNENEAGGKKLISEIRRTLASCRGALKNGDVSEIIFCGSKSHFELCTQQLESAFKYPIECVEPASWLSPGTLDLDEYPTKIERFSSMFGTLSQESKSTKHQLDLKNPRKPIIEKKFDQRKAIWIGAVAATFVLALIAISWFLLKSQTDKIAVLQKQVQELKDENAGRGRGPNVEKALAEVEKLDEWKLNDTNWLEQLSTISKNMKSADDAIIDGFVAEKQLIKINGRTSDKSGNEIKLGLIAAYDVEDPGGVKPLKDDAEYSYSFSHNLTIEQDKEEQIRSINDMARDRQQSQFDSEPSDDDSATDSESEG